LWLRLAPKPEVKNPALRQGGHEEEE
jgi:hypothetical protein